MEQQQYAARRQALLRQLEDNSIVIIHSAKEILRNGDSGYPFRQDSDFYYLTGFDEPESCLFLIKQGAESQYILFNRENNYQEELWEGLRAGQPGACQQYGADISYPIAELEQKLPELLANKEHIYYRIGQDSQLDSVLPNYLAQLQKQVRKGVVAPQHLHDIRELLAEMRLIKSPEEVAILRSICQISAEAHCKTMQAAKGLAYEYQLQAILQSHLMMNGAKHMAYPPIVASGANACILHYTENNQALAEDDLILIDAGGELNNYAADITRTFPKSGKFSNEQRAIYELVLKSQKAAIEIIKPGLAWHKVQEVIIQVIAEGLIALDILQGSVEQVIEQKAYQDFYMHNSGHWLGLDVHDSGAYKEHGQWRPLKAGMVLTVEPGIYIAAHHQSVDKRWHNIGVRIEDDILVTDNGYENLTQLVPREINEIEALMNNG